MQNPNCFTIYDSKAEAYLVPFFEKTTALAIRAITSAVNDPKHQFSKYPEDYTLFHLGEYDEDNATFHLHTTPVSLGVAIEFKKPDNQPQLPLED